MVNVHWSFCVRNWIWLKLKTGVRNKSLNSPEWLKRRQNDPYIEKAKELSYRCRSAFKLLEIDNKYKFLKPGLKVLDVGAAPGSWSQVLAQKTNSDGRDEASPKGVVIAIDLNPIYKIEGVNILDQMDFTHESSQNKIKEILKGEKLDYVCSDIAPPSSGVKSLDQENILKLVFPVLIFSLQNLRNGGGCLIKMWEGQHNNLANEMKRFFRLFNFIKPNATYSSSSEIYLFGRDFMGVKK